MPSPRNEPLRRLKASDDTDTGGGPHRQCIVTRESLPQDALIRFVRSPDGVAVPDVLAKLPGRGAWVKADRASVEKAIKTDAFSRAFKAKTAPIDDMTALIEDQLVQRCLGLLGMARKAGEVILGFDQVRDYLRKDSPGHLIEASDGSEDGRNKVHFLAKAMYDTPRTAGALTSAELGMAFGRGRVIHALLQEGPLSDSFGTAYKRLVGFRTAPEQDWFSSRNR
ncbi:RNA-binding protein [Henriciella aquimarina]|uniref:RNA-binding protein n=1 Tax=Henriciella aquimarina TaxID=545261 RepID=UPI0009FC2560|nr:RNA-binding protein [Henriciella aquimarina]